MGDEGMPHGMDTIIYLVQKLVTEQGSPSSKRRRKETRSVDSEEKVDKIHGDSRRLRQCSRYFETSMNERWAHSKPLVSQMEFHLELQTDVIYYQDCFSRVKPLAFLKPIPNVEHCLQLLKVAQQIVYQDVVDLGIKYLSAAPWSSDEEKEIRSFCESGHIFLDPEVHGDLIARLRLSLTEKERQEELSKFTQGVVSSQYLQHALSELCTIPDSCQLFEEAFEKTMSGSNDYAQVQCVILVKTETARLLLSFKSRSLQSFREDFLGFCWMYKLLRSVNAAQSVVDLLLKEEDVRYSMYLREDLDQYSDEKANKKWIKLMHSMLQDVLDGRLFLSSSDRYKLFMDWCGIFDPCFQHVFDLNDLSELFTTYIMTFPLQKQAEMIQRWEERKDDGFGTYKYFVFHTYEKWMMRLVNELASKRAPELTAAEGELLDSGE